VSADPGLLPSSPALLAQGYGANAYAYGGQSIVNIALQQGVPAHDVEGYAYPGSSDQAASGAAGDGDASLLPVDDSSWVRFAIGFGLGWLAVSWAGRRT
jgi:hypothetical protein